MATDTPLFSKKKKSFPLLKTIFGLIVVLVIALSVGFDANKLKPKIYQLVKEQTNLAISIGDISYFPMNTDKLTVTEFKAGQPGSGFYVAFEELFVDLSLLPLISKNVSVDEIELTGVVVDVTQKGVDAVLANMPKKAETAQTDAPAEPPVGDVSIDEIVIVLNQVDVRWSGKTIALNDARISLAEVTVMENGVFDLAKLSTQLSVELAKLAVQSQQLTDFKLQADLNNNLLNLINVSGNLLEGQFAVKMQTNLVTQAVKVEQVKLANMQVVINQALLDEFGITLPQADEKKEQPEEPSEPAETASLAEVNVEELTVENVNFDYQLSPAVSLKGINLNATNISLNELLAKVLSNPLNANLDIAEIRFKDIPLGRLSSTVEWQGKVAKITQFTLAPTKGDWLAVTLSAASDLGDSGGLTSLALEKFHLDAGLINQFLPDANIKPEGSIDLSGDLSVPVLVTDQKQQLANTSGDIKLVSNDFALNGIDIDSMLDGLKDSQEIGLKDIGGFALGGPLGLLAGNLFDVGGGAVTGTGGRTDIGGLELSASIDKGIMKLKDTALATSNHRVAFDGGIDLANQSFKDFDFALLNEKGCATIKQTLNGAVTNPTSAVANTLLGTVLNPLKGMFKNLTNLGDSKCDVFYQGAVAHP